MCVLAMDVTLDTTHTSGRRGRTKWTQWEGEEGEEEDDEGEEEERMLMGGEGELGKGVSLDRFGGIPLQNEPKEYYSSILHDFMNFLRLLFLKSTF